MSARREVARLGEQEQADLRDVRARRDVDEVVLALGVERIAAREVVERGVDLLEVPGVVEVDGVPHDVGLGRDRGDVRGDGVGELARAAARASSSRRSTRRSSCWQSATVGRQRSQRAGPWPASSVVPRRPKTTSGRADMVRWATVSARSSSHVSHFIQPSMTGPRKGPRPSSGTLACSSGSASTRDVNRQRRR